MKYNSDICPMKKQIGEKIEKYLKTQNKEDLEGFLDCPHYCYIGVDKNKSFTLFNRKPEVYLSAWQWLFPPNKRHNKCISYIGMIDWEVKEAEYIHDYWTDLLFRV